MLESSRKALIAEVFPSIGEPMLAEVMRRADYLEADLNEVIVSQGDLADAMFIIEAGSVDIRERSAGSQQDELLATLHRGQFFGEIGTLTSGRRNASAYARTRTRLIRLDRDTLDFIAGYHQPFGPATGDDGDSSVPQWDEAWTKVVRSACHTLAVAHGAIRSVDVTLRPTGYGGPMQLVALMGRAREIAWDYGVQVNGKFSVGRSVIHLSASPTE
jgi:hypothetical protein